MRLSEVGIGKLRKINVMIKKWFKKILHLPEWMPDDWVHSKVGGDLQNILEQVLKMRRKASEKMVESKDQVASEVAIEEDLQNAANLRRIQLDYPVKDLKRVVNERRMDRLRAVTNGRAIVVMGKSVVKRDWLWYGTTVRSCERIVAWKFLSGTLPTRINQTRGNPDQNRKKCRQCRATAETDLHILAECSRTKDLRSLRHNKVCDKVAKRGKERQPRDNRTEGKTMANRPANV